MRRRRTRGVTLVELVISIVIVSIAVLGLMLVIAGTAGRSGDALVEQQASAIAQAYLEEVMLANFCDPDFVLAGQTCRQQCTARACTTGACGGTGAFKEGSRALYDDVCDYRGLDDSGAADRSGAAIAGLDGYRVRVAVDDAGVTLGSPALDSDAGEVVRIDVSVSHAARDGAVTLSAFRANTQ